MVSAASSQYVRDLTEENFRAFIEGNHIAVVSFFLPWLDSYKKFELEYEEVDT